jgi:hypothetical protein
VSIAIGLGLAGAALVAFAALGTGLGFGLRRPIAWRAYVRRGIRSTERHLREQAHDDAP